MSVNNHEVELAGAGGNKRYEKSLEKTRLILGHEAASRFCEVTENLPEAERTKAFSQLGRLANFLYRHVDQPGDEHEDEYIVDPNSLTKRMPKPFRDIFGEVPDHLTTDDTEVMVATLMELRGPVKKFRGKNSIDVEGRLRALVSGTKVPEIVELEGGRTKAVTIRAWMQRFRDDVMQQEGYYPMRACNLLWQKLDEAKQESVEAFAEQIETTIDFDR